MEETDGDNKRVKSRTAEDEERRRVGKRQDLSPTTWRAAGVQSRVDSTVRGGSLAPGSRRMSLPRFRRSMAKPGTASRDGRENGAGGERRTGKENHRAGLSIDSIPKPRDSVLDKGAEPHTKGAGGRNTWRRPMETRESRAEQQRTRTEDELVNARTCLQQPGEQRESGAVWIRQREEDHWPREADE
ncbi:hypothetical protein NDU88_004629 [Pleurodeles waltl]|uniref:Uncharacterized protein n=1 Tax=Pleurodeles waltl TaxID=8319 RepID=A0AAV7UGN0_PLEWA|nr:hypothetical protein NDU88_004629 [Pleurodeles waltl]